MDITTKLSPQTDGPFIVSSQTKRKGKGGILSVIVSEKEKNCLTLYGINTNKLKFGLESKWRRKGVRYVLLCNINMIISFYKALSQSKVQSALCRKENTIKQCEKNDNTRE